MFHGHLPPPAALVEERGDEGFDAIPAGIGKDGQSEGEV